MPLSIVLDYDRGVPIYRQVLEAVLQALARGDLRAGEQLPTINQLAKQLEINPNTVARAYRELEREGHVVATRGRGTYPTAKPAPKQRRGSLIREIVNRALEEGARHGLTGAELEAYLRKVIA